MKAVHKKIPTAHYLAKHPLYGKDNKFTSWLTLSETTVDIAEEEAKKRLINQLVELTGTIADEMIETVEEIKTA